MKFVPFKNDAVTPHDSHKMGSSRLGSFRIGSFRLGSFRDTSPKDMKSDRRSGSNKNSRNSNSNTPGHDSEDESYENCNTRFISGVESDDEVASVTTTTKHTEPAVVTVVPAHMRY